MNAKTKAAVQKHGENLLAIFPNATTRDPNDLYKKLRWLESKGNALGRRLCNGPHFPADGRNSADSIWESILAQVRKLLGVADSEAMEENIIKLNLDPRGYALKIRTQFMQAHPELRLHTDFGGYGILDHDLTEG